MTYTYKTKGTCSSYIQFELDGKVVKNVSFKGGCNGNLKGIAKLTEGMTMDEIKEKLSGITCGHKSTSCPDQFARALNEISKQDK
ncbi:TIGR03905 family TSCPD domain-containing protein [Anaerovorax odorimutans]|uniref:TIGR03905 family TSCPD domain-containing protein n=1 Tax=Anaerovorax odorimutans TaxID=109327 RepID=UPI00041FAAC0|nr:TIGR03905 family TSCPD domain-containing protein [Anaerovorax odorimutans]